MLEFQVGEVHFKRLTVGDTILFSQHDSSGEKQEDMCLILRLHIMGKEEKYVNDGSEFFIKLGNDASLK